jgi:hypothetical protein
LDRFYNPLPYKSKKMSSEAYQGVQMSEETEVRGTEEFKGKDTDELGHWEAEKRLANTPFTHCPRVGTVEPCTLSSSMTSATASVSTTAAAACTERSTPAPGATAELMTEPCRSSSCACSSSSPSSESGSPRSSY